MAGNVSSYYSIEDLAMDVIGQETSEHETSEQLSRALGAAVIRLWSYMPHDVQYHLFEDVINHQDETMRPQLAVLLHDNHLRTSAGKKARAMLEPDSLGG
jgi:hypothetical protein